MILAVHLSDSVLQDPWWIAGWTFAAPLLAWSARRLEESELSRLGVLTAAFFVASQVHLPLGGVSVHLLLNGLVGLILRRRAPLAIAVGLFLQAALFGHGGWSTLGINILIYTVPALLAGYGFPFLTQTRWFRYSLVRSLIVGGLLFLWLLLVTTTLQWSLSKVLPSWASWSPNGEDWWIINPLVVTGVCSLTLLLTVLEPRLERSPLFPLGLFLGALTGFLTLGLNILVLLLGSKPEFEALPGLVLLVHLPIVVIESLAIGFVVVYLQRAKPEWLEPRATSMSV